MNVKERWVQFCKAVAPHMDAICEAMTEVGMEEGSHASIAIYTDGHVSMFAKCDGAFYNCAAMGKEDAYEITKDIAPEEGGEDYIGTLPRSQKGGKTNESTQSGPHCQTSRSGAEETDQGGQAQAGSGEVAGDA